MIETDYRKIWYFLAWSEGLNNMNNIFSFVLKTSPHWRCCQSCHCFTTSSPDVNQWPQKQHLWISESTESTASMNQSTWISESIIILTCLFWNFDHKIESVNQWPQISESTWISDHKMNQWPHQHDLCESVNQYCGLLHHLQLWQQRQGYQILGIIGNIFKGCIEY